MLDIENSQGVVAAVAGDESTGDGLGDLIEMHVLFNLLSHHVHNLFGAAGVGDENAAFTNRSFISLTESEREYHGESGRFLRISEQSAQCANLRSFPFLRKKAAPFGAALAGGSVYSAS